VATSCIETHSNCKPIQEYINENRLRKPYMKTCSGTGDLEEE
jgi:hypothetical protein